MRAPLLPLDVFFEICKPEGEQMMGKWIEENPGVNFALQVGSPSLYAAWKRQDGEQDPKIQRKLLRYIIRMSSRPTPFGGFAGVALGRWSSESDLALEKSRVEFHTRLDLGIITKLAMESEKRSLEGLELRTNPSILLHSGQVYLAEKAPGLDIDDVDGVSASLSPVVRAVLEVARKPAPISKLIKRLVVGFRMGEDEARHLIRELMEHTFLISSLRPDTFEKDYTRRVIALLQKRGEDKPLADQLRGIVDQLEAIDSTKDATKIQMVESLTEQCRNALSDSPPFFHAEAKLNLHGKSLNRTIADEACSAMDLYCRLRLGHLGHPYLDEYRKRFVERYGGQEVPLLEAVNQDFGIGLPDMDSDSPPLIVEERKQRLLNQLVFEAVRDRKIEVELSDAAVDRLNEQELPHDQLPLSFDFYVSVLASSAQDIDRGDFILVVRGIICGASRNIGRFADMLGEDAVSALAETHTAESRAIPNKRITEIGSIPRNLRSSNMARATASDRPRINLDSWDTNDANGALNPGDMVIGVSGNRFYLRAQEYGPDIEFRSPHQLNSKMWACGTRLTRFLMDVSRDRVFHSPTFNWGSCKTGPFLPRVKYRKTIVSSARWRIQRSDFESSQLCSPESFRLWVGGWRSRWFVPRFVTLGDSDVRLLLDLENDAHLEELRSDLKNSDESPLWVEEAFCEPQYLWASNGNSRFASELVIPLVRAEDSWKETRVARNYRINASEKVRQPSRMQRLLPPGSSCLYMKLYAGTQATEEILRDEIYDWIIEALSKGTIESWFFLRYSDPETHVRLRVFGDPDTLMSVAYPNLSRLGNSLMRRGLCYRFVFDTYDREIERHGGWEAMSSAEAVFDADSHYAAQLIKLEAEEAFVIPRARIVVFNIEQMLRALGLDAAQRGALYELYGEKWHESGQLYRDAKVELASLLESYRVMLPNSLALAIDTWSAKLKRHGKKFRLLENNAALTRNRQSVFRGFVHLHCNRLGILTDYEHLLLGVAARLCDAELRRKRGV